QVLDKAIRQLLDDTNTELSSIDWMIPHQANARMIQATAEKLGLSFERVMITLNQHANTSAASIPLAFDWGIRQQKIKRGQRLLFEAIGAGLTWGTALVQY
ncbi:MAG: 3-oxoacyl-ACP synthase, partial [Gammaproteobacteria bacterium]|nr:3-oxoacyl-ACP synthase [Gammaproteobacteria bacterium]